MTNALIVVDAQQVFVDGDLGVERGPQIIGWINDEMQADADDHLIILTGDQHTKETDPAHFAQYGEHAVKGSTGAAWHNRLMHTYAHAIIDKGAKKADPSPFDGFERTSGKSLRLVLQEAGVSHVKICGFVAEVCVDACWRHSLEYGFHTSLLASLVGGITREGKSDALVQAARAGVVLL